MIKAILENEMIFSASNEAFSLYDKSSLGERKENRIVYSNVEACFLLKNNKMQIVSGKKELSFEEFLKKISKRDSEISKKLLVYSDLKRKGYVLKSALKFGADFRIYEKNNKIGKDHAKWLLYITTENQKNTWQEFTAKNRVAHSTKKKLLIAIIDQEEDISYFEINWIRP